MRHLFGLLGAFALMALTALPSYAASTQCFQSLSGAINQQVITRGGTTYTSGTTGLICSVASSDFTDVEKSGYVSLGTPQAKVTFSTTAIQNPALLFNVSDTTALAISQTTNTIVASTATTILYPGFDISLMSSGTPTTPSSVSVKCTNGTTDVLLLTVPIALFVDKVPVGPASSSTITKGAALTTGCPVGYAIVVSPNGTQAYNASDLFVSVPLGIYY